MKNHSIFKNFSIFSESEEGIKNLQSLIFQLALKGKLDFKKLSDGKIKKPLKVLVEEQKAYLKKESIAFEEQLDSVWPMMELEEVLEKVKYTNKIKKSSFLKEGLFPIIDQSENFIAGYWNKRTDVFKIKNPVVIFGDHTCCFKYIDFDFVLGADGVKIIQPNKQFLPFFLYYILLNTKIRNLGYSRHFKVLKKVKIPVPPLSVQKEIVALMKKCGLLSTQTKEKSQKQEAFSKSSMYFITQSKNTKELGQNWHILGNNFESALYTKNGMQNFKSMVFQLALHGRLDFQKLSNGRIKKSLKALVEEQKSYFKKEGIAFEEQPDSVWPMVGLEEILDYEQPTKYIVQSTNYKHKYKTPVLTAGKSFLLGYTKETSGIFPKEKLPVIIFDDFTTATKFVDFPFKVKSSAMKILNLSNKLFLEERINESLKDSSKQKVSERQFLKIRTDIRTVYIKFIFYIMQDIKVDIKTHKRHWISKYSKIKIPMPPLSVQKEIVTLMEKCVLLEEQIQKEKDISLQLSKSLSHIENYQKAM